MSSEALHVPHEKLSRKTLQMHYAIASLMEELEAVDWYRQRADDLAARELRAIVRRNARDEDSITGREEDASEQHGL